MFLCRIYCSRCVCSQNFNGCHFHVHYAMQIFFLKQTRCCVWKNRSGYLSSHPSGTNAVMRMVKSYKKHKTFQAMTVNSVLALMRTLEGRKASSLWFVNGCEHAGCQRKSDTGSKNKYITVERRALNATDRNDAHRKAKMESMQNYVECFLSLKWAVKYTQVIKPNTGVI